MAPFPTTLRGAFQHLEDSVNDLSVLLADTDDSAVRILANDLEHGKRLNTADVLFAYFVDFRNNTRAEAKSEFHRIIFELRELGERSNELVHSALGSTSMGAMVCCGRASKLSGSKGLREEREEELHPQAFDGHLQRLASAAAKLETFSLLVITWLYPEQ